MQQSNVENGQNRPPTPPADVFKKPASPRPSYVVERISLHTIQPVKRPSSEDVNHDTVKEPTTVYEDISPVKNEKTIIPQDLVEYLYTPVFQD